MKKSHIVFAEVQAQELIVSLSSTLVKSKMTSKQTKMSSQMIQREISM